MMQQVARPLRGTGRHFRAAQAPGPARSRLRPARCGGARTSAFGCSVSRLRR